VFELFRPREKVTTADRGIWFRGYVVSTSAHPRLPPNSNDVYAFPSHAGMMGLTEEPQGVPYILGGPVAGVDGTQMV
jgi:hypothetical protein